MLLQKFKLFLVFSLLFIASASFAQQQKVHSYKLNRLGLKSNMLYDIMNEVNTYIGSKSKGFKYPVTKLVFSSYNDKFNIDVIGIDNSWTNLFRQEESPLGYCILGNRLFIFSADKIDRLLIEKFFETYEDVKSFTEPPVHLQNPRIQNPSWFYDYNSEVYSLVGVRNLDVLE